MAGDAKRMMDGIFVGRHERTCASIVPLTTWIVEKHESSAEDCGPAVGQRIHSKVPRSAVDAHWRRPKPQARPPPVPAVVMHGPEASVTAPQQRRRCMKQDVARYGPTPGCEACVEGSSGRSHAA